MPKGLKRFKSWYHHVTSQDGFCVAGLDVIHSRQKFKDFMLFAFTAEMKNAGGGTFYMTGQIGNYLRHNRSLPTFLLKKGMKPLD